MGLMTRHARGVELRRAGLSHLHPAPPVPSLESPSPLDAPRRTPPPGRPDRPGRPRPPASSTSLLPPWVQSRKQRLQTQGLGERAPAGGRRRARLEDLVSIYGAAVVLPRGEPRSVPRAAHGDIRGLGTQGAWVLVLGCRLRGPAVAAARTNVADPLMPGGEAADTTLRTFGLFDHLRQPWLIFLPAASSVTLPA